MADRASVSQPEFVRPITDRVLQTQARRPTSGFLRHFDKKT
jgi:hypothetical protein